MTYEKLWSAIIGLADCWRRSTTTRQFAALFPGNQKGALSGLPKYLQELDAAVHVLNNPLRFATGWAFWQQIPAMFQGPSAAVLSPWLAAGRSLETGHRSQMAWLRARLPGYPTILPPQLAKGTQFTTLEYTEDIIWTPGEMGRGLQFIGAPQYSSESLGLGESDTKLLANAERVVATAFEESSEWRALLRSWEALGRDDRTVLAELRRDLVFRLSDPEVLRIAGHGAISALAYRKSVLEDGLSSLRGNAADYALAFREATRLLDFAADGILSQLIIYGEPETLGVAGEFEAVSEANLTVVSFVADFQRFPQLGRVYWTDGGLGSDPIRLEAMNFTMNQADGVTIRVRGRVIDDFSASWPLAESSAF